jgi:hypothetical protein
MGTNISNPDAAFFTLLHQSADLPGDKDAERRRRSRRPFPAVQRIAPGASDKVPPESAFIRVQCQDLTETGFSFFSPSKPRFERLVVALGERRREIYVEAEVKHCREVLVDREGQIVRGGKGSIVGRPMVLVGCRFLRRLEARATASQKQ